MNYNEEVPDFLGGLGDVLPADVLKKVEVLLKQLLQADKEHQGSHYQFVYVAPGAQHVERQYIKTHPWPLPRDHGDRFLNDFTEFIQKPVPMISDRWNRQKLSRSVIVKMADMPICRQ